MKIHQLKCLVAAAGLGSFRMAAAELGRSPTAVSNALRELEQEMDAQLVNRHIDGVKLTEAGEAFVRHAKLVLDHLCRAAQEVRDIEGMARQRLNIATTPWMTPYIIAPAITAFRQRRPDVQIMVMEHLGNDYALLRDGTVELAFGSAPRADHLVNLDATPWFGHSPAVIARRGHPAEHARTWEELHDYDWIVTRTHRDILPDFGSQCPTINAKIAAGIQPIHFVESTMTALSLIRATDMIAYALWPEIEMPGIRNEVVALNLPSDEPVITTSLVTRKRDLLSAVAMAFLECVKTAVADFEDSTDAAARRMFSTVERLNT